MPVCSATPLLFISGAPGSGELLVLFVLVLLLFGPRKLPEIARTIGRVLDDLRRASQDFKNQVMSIESSESSDATDLQRALHASAPEGTHNRAPDSSGGDPGACSDETGDTIDDAPAADDYQCPEDAAMEADVSEPAYEQEPGADERSPDAGR